MGLVHMNGRVYDPALGRFLSVDPVFQFPTNTQSLNPYTYVLNSPLSFTDPTGLKCASGDGEDQACVEDKPNDTGDPRSKFRDRNDKKFEEKGETSTGTKWTRNLANGTDTRAAASRFDRLVGKINAAIEGLATRLDNFDGANSTGGSGSTGSTGGTSLGNASSGGTIAAGARNISPAALRGMAGAFRGLFQRGNVDLGAAMEGPGGNKYSPLDVINIYSHLVRLARGYGYDWTSDGGAKPDRTMFLRVALGKSDKYTVAWYHHEENEATAVQELRGATDDVFLEAQGKAHLETFRRQGNTQFDLWHPAVVRAFPSDFSDPRYHRY